MAKAGRPTKYNQEMIDKALHYLDNYQDNGDVIPSIEGLAEHLEINRATIYDWKDQEGKEEFSDILGQILARQARVLINQGLKGEFNAAICKLALGKHGYHDKQETDVTSGGKPLNTWTINPVTTDKNG